MLIILWRFLLFFSSGDAEPSLAAELKEILKAIDRQERSSSGYVEDRVSDSAAYICAENEIAQLLAEKMNLPIADAERLLAESRSERGWTRRQ